MDDKIQKLIRRDILESSPFPTRLDNGIRLDQNECPFDLPDHLKDKIYQKLQSVPLNRYPLEDLSKLHQKLADQLRQNPNQLLLANGSDSLIQALVDIIAPEKKILLFDPCFGQYSLQAKLKGIATINIALDENFQIPMGPTEQALSDNDISLVFIPYPNVPNGGFFKQEDIASLASQTNSLVVIDEAYFPLSSNTCIDLTQKYDNLIILRSFSKGFGLAAIRCGYLVAHEKIVKQVEKALLPYRLNRFSLACLDVVLDHLSEIEELKNKTIAEKEWLTKQLSSLDGIEVYSSDVHFFLVKIKNAVAVAKHLKEKSLIVNVPKQEGLLVDCLRVSVGTREENIKLIEALKTP